MTAAIPPRLRDALGERYQIEREIGRGGMAAVYLATDLKHGRRVAVKVLHPGLEVVGGAERFRREIEIAAGLSHPNILPLLDSGSDGDLRYYIMPYVEGESLRARLDREGQLSLREAIRIARAVGAGLGQAHQKGLVHRDIKPENILLSEAQVLVADFGIARAVTSNENLTATGYSLGTPHYSSPEQVTASRHVDARSDLYSLGCVLYEMLAGHPPFLGSSWREVMGRHAIDPVPSLRSARPSVPPGLERAIQRALAKTPADRFDSVAAFLAALPGEAELALAETGAGPSLAVPRRGVRRRQILLGAGALAALAVAGWGASRLLSRGERPAASDRILLAVLPLHSVNRPQDEYFADGLSEEIATRLARVKGLGVIGRNAQLRSGRAEESAVSVGRRLGVRYVLDGTVQWAETVAAPEVKITAQLIEVATGVTIGGGVFAGVLANVFDLQTRIAEQVVEELRLQLGESERVAIRNAATQNVEAYNLYALGRYHWKKRTAEGMALAVEAFDRALAADPRYARSYAGLADAYILYPQYGVTAVSPREAFARARAAATRALELDPELAEAHASLGEIATYADWDWAGAERHLRRSIDLDPDYATARQWYAELLAILGRFDEAIEQGRLAARLDPTSAVTAHSLAHPLLASHRWREALDAYEEALARDPGFSYARLGMIWAAALAGDRDRGQVLLTRFGDTTELMRAWVNSLADPRGREEARRLALGQEAEVAALPAHVRAPLLAGLGMDDQALEVLERAAAGRGIAALGLKSMPLYDGLRSNPRFVSLVKQLGLPPDRHR